jgi:hypothetical protein
MAGLPTAAQRLEEIVAMTFLEEADPEPQCSWQLYLDLWAQAARNAAVASVRQKSDERWREVIKSLVLAGLDAGEFRTVPDNFAACLTALLDGLTIQIALDDPSVDPVTAFEISMHYVATQLGFEWTPGRGRGEDTRKDLEKGR